MLPSDGQNQLLPGVSETSAETQRLVDTEVHRIVESAHAEATQVLIDHRANLDALVAQLLEHETLDEAEAYAAASLPRERVGEPRPELAPGPSVICSPPPRGV